MTRGADSNGLAAAAARLTTRYGAHLPAAAIREVLYETHQRLLARATVTTYLPLLAERAAAAQLGDLVSEAESRTAGTGTGTGG
jgi:hypothetical protein